MELATRFVLALITAAAICGPGVASAGAVLVPTDGFAVNLGLLLQAGHEYDFYDWKNETEDSSRFSVSDAEVRLYGRIFESVNYDLRTYRFSGLREASLGADLPAGLSVKIGKHFVPFGVEATTQEGDLTCSSRANSSAYIAPGRNTGVRFDYLRERDSWPYEIGASAGVYNDDGPLVAGAGRIFGRPLPGLKNVRLGFSYYYEKTQRSKYRGRYGPPVKKYLEEPRAGADLAFEYSNVYFLAEYTQHFVNDYAIQKYPAYGIFLYKDTYNRGYFALCRYFKELPWRYFQGFQPYLRYERYEPAVVERGIFPTTYYTGGFALHFLGRNLMFRSDYTRVLEDECPTTNDRIASEFQVMF